MSDSHISIKKSASSFFYGTLLSRISGMARDMVLAYFFGSSVAISAFMVAFRLANFFRRLLGENSLQAGFVPHFEAIKSQEPHRAALFYRDLFFTMLVILIFVVIGSELILFISGIFILDHNVKQIVYLTAIMLPGLIFICLYSLNSSLLQCEKSYFLPAVAPVFFNLIWIFSLFMTKKIKSQFSIFFLAV